MATFHPLDYDRRRDAFLYRDLTFHRTLYTQERAKRAEQDALTHPSPEMFARADQRHQEVQDAAESLFLWKGRIDYLDAVIDAVHELRTRAIDAETPQQILDRQERERGEREQVYLIEAAQRQAERDAAQRANPAICTPPDPFFDAALEQARAHHAKLREKERERLDGVESNRKRRTGITTLDAIQAQSGDRRAAQAQEASQAQLSKMKTAAARRVKEAARSRANRAKAKTKDTSC